MYRASTAVSIRKYSHASSFTGAQKILHGKKKCSKLFFCVDTFFIALIIYKHGVVCS